ncbi:hypothetical protein MFIFM68171_07039 [Madurella fahalii]|uniref:MHYT domain-containing protein n=1 Tax=Madurella fahalii TaxID=1157608 RepID=A0ABQ0GGL2_9PEZI
METAATGRLAQYLGHVVPVTFDPTLLGLSYLISFIGAASTLELINRRTSWKGYYNNLLLLGASVTMGGVAIWSMHYIGNRATRLLDGEPDLQIVSPNNYKDEVNWWRIGISGTLSGGAICGMHYLGNASISNYCCDYAAANVTGSAVIAAVASTIALAHFFVFRSAWTSSWWKRVGCAIVLAGTVSGMHWCAATGTAEARHTTAIVVSCLAFAACLIIAGSAVYSARTRKSYANGAQKITLAAAIFDQ